MKYLLIILALIVCPTSVYATKFYIDPVNGDMNNTGAIDSPWSTLEAVVAANYIVSNEYGPLPYNAATSVLVPKNTGGFVHAGDTLVLMDGLHGTLVLEKYINTAPITIMGMEGETAVLKNIHLRTCKHWRFENVTISSEPYGMYLNAVLFFIESHAWQGPSSHIEIDRCDIFSGETPWTTAEDWNSKMSNGIYINADSVLVSNSMIRNINFGLQAVGNYIEARNNQVINFAGDGMRIIGSNITFSHNLIKNCYVVNDNHDDGIQSWAQINGVVSDDNQVIGNIIINTDDPSRPLNGPLQGIGCFDGFFNRWVVANNLILVDHWHGIAFYGANDCHIINNTVLDLTPDMAPGPSWIRVDDHDGVSSTGCVVVNNVANSFHVNGELFNNVVFDTYQQYEDNFVDYANFDFHLTANSTLIDGADSTYASNVDIEGNPRPFGDLPDIGAYEYSGISTTASTTFDGRFLVYPNPFTTSLSLEGPSGTYQLEMRDLYGKLVHKTPLLHEDRQTIYLPDLKKGMYFLTIKTSQEKQSKTIKLIKH